MPCMRTYFDIHHIVNPHSFFSASLVYNLVVQLIRVWDWLLLPVNCNNRILRVFFRWLLQLRKLRLRTRALNFGPPADPRKLVVSVFLTIIGRHIWLISPALTSTLIRRSGLIYISHLGPFLIVNCTLVTHLRIAFESTRYGTCQAANTSVYLDSRCS